MSNIGTFSSLETPNKGKQFHCAPSEIAVHQKLSNLFPINPRVLKAIEEDMRTAGFRESHPIETAVWPGQEEPAVVDGHTRLAASLSLGLPVVLVHEIAFNSEEEAIEYAIHNQRDRRNLSAAELHALIQAIDRPFAHGGDRKRGKIKSSQEDLEKTSAKETVDAMPGDQVDPGPHEKTSLKDTARRAGVSEKTVQRSRLVASDPEVEAKVRSGDISSLKEAAQQVQERRRLGFGEDVIMLERDAADLRSVERFWQGIEEKPGRLAGRGEDDSGPSKKGGRARSSYEPRPDSTIEKKTREAVEALESEISQKMWTVCADLCACYTVRELRALIAHLNHAIQGCHLEDRVTYTK